MPSSQYSQISGITQAIHMLKPKSVLDIGIGFGKYGFLCREYLELCDGREQYDDWQHRIDGVEVFPEYVGKLQNDIYSNIYIGNALNVLPKLDHHYGLTLIIDVLEHFTYEDGLKVLECCKLKSDNVLISVPKDIGNQGEMFHNEHEAHLYQWATKDIKAMFGDAHIIDNSQSYIWVCGKDIKDMKMKMLKNKLYKIKKKIL